MKLSFKILAILFSAVYFQATYAAGELRAIAEDGRKVILSPDGRWKFDSTVPLATSSPNGSDSPYQTVVKRFSLTFNPSIWILTPQQDNEGGNKRVFRHKSLPLYGMVIADELPATTEAIRNVILYNAQSKAGSEPTVLLDKTKKINGHSVGLIRFAATLGGVEFVLGGHYYGDSDGNIQVMCYTGQQIFHKYEADCQQFIDGLTIKDIAIPANME